MTLGYPTQQRRSFWSVCDPFKGKRGGSCALLCGGRRFDCWFRLPPGQNGRPQRCIHEHFIINPWFAYIHSVETIQTSTFSFFSWTASLHYSFQWLPSLCGVEIRWLCSWVLILLHWPVCLSCVSVAGLDAAGLHGGSPEDMLAVLLRFCGPDCWRCQSSFLVLCSGLRAMLHYGIENVLLFLIFLTKICIMSSLNIGRIPQRSTWSRSSLVGRAIVTTPF